MRTDKTLLTVKSESDYDLRAWRILGAEHRQLCALIYTFRNKGFVLRFIWRSGSGTKGGKTFSIGWRTDSARWQKTFRNVRKGVLGLELSTSANGPYMSR